MESIGTKLILGVRWDVIGLGFNVREWMFSIG